MKKFSLALGACIALLIACGNPARDKIEVETVEEMTTDTSKRFEIIQDSSKIYCYDYPTRNQAAKDSAQITGGEILIDEGEVKGEFAISPKDNSIPPIKFTLSEIRNVENNKFVTHTIGGALDINGEKENILIDVKTEEEDGRYYIHSVPFRVSRNQWNGDTSPNSNTNDSTEIEFKVVAKRTK